jgi:hypothetical protein
MLSTSVATSIFLTIKTKMMMSTSRAVQVETSLTAILIKLTPIPGKEAGKKGPKRVKSQKPTKLQKPMTSPPNSKIPNRKRLKRMSKTIINKAKASKLT